MTGRPYTLLSCAVSVDGCLDDASAERLVLSGPEDLDEVDKLRAAADAILVGAGTIRADDPRLLVRDPNRVVRRVAAAGRRTRCGSLSPPPGTWTRPPASSPSAAALRWCTAPRPPLPPPRRGSAR